MKKKLFVSLLLALALLLSLGISAHAAQLDFVSDYANILTDSEKQDLNEMAARLSGQYDFGVYVVVVGNHKEYVNGTIAKFAEEIFHHYGLGYGQNEDGILLAMSMDERDYDVYAHGYGNYAFTDYGKKQLEESFLDDFRRNDWAGGFRDYIDKCGDMLRLAKEGNPVDTWIPGQAEEPGIHPFDLLVSLLIGGVSGTITVAGMKKQMKTAVKQTGAEEYIARGGVNLRAKQDDFVNRTVTRQPLPRPNSPGNRPGGGHFGGTTISGSHGGSHSSGKF